MLLFNDKQQKWYKPVKKIYANLIIRVLIMWEWMNTPVSWNKYMIVKYSIVFLHQTNANQWISAEAMFRCNGKT